jgi:1-phosphatidylinositol phosphodiesterase
MVIVGAAAGGAVALPGTAFAADASYRSLTSASNPDWMRSVPDSRSLAGLSVPGTHQTLSIHGGSLVQTQENHGDSGRTLLAQLNAGIR